MFWKFIELLVRILFFRRFRQADRLGRAARQACEGHGEEALRCIDAEQATLHPSLRPLFHAVRARTLEALGRESEAHTDYVAAAVADPSHRRAQLDLALSEVQMGLFDRAVGRLRQLVDDADTEQSLRAVAVEALARIESGGDVVEAQNQ